MSTLRTNALEGMDAKNSITIVAGAGNITTTNVQEGLAKYSGVFDNKDAALGSAYTNDIRDSFNISGITDNFAGDFTVAFTNAMSNEFYSALGNVSGENNVYGVLCSQDTHSTTGCGYQSRDTSGTVTDVDKNSFAGIGDLA